MGGCMDGWEGERAEIRQLKGLIDRLLIVYVQYTAGLLDGWIGSRDMMTDGEKD